MIKNIYTVTLFLIAGLSINATAQYPVDSQEIDDQYLQMSLEEKLKLIIISSNDMFDDQPMKWLNFDELLELSGAHPPLLSDMMIRSALLKGENDHLIQLATDLLLKNKYDGFCYSMKSPYALMFRDNSERPADFFLEAYRRISIPYHDNAGDLQYFIANAYSMPKQALAPHSLAEKVIDERFLGDGLDYSSGLQWKQLQQVLEEYENPSLEFILTLGGFLYSDSIHKELDELKRIFEDKLLPVNILEKSVKKMLYCRQLIKNKPGVNNFYSKNQEVDIFVRELYKDGVVLLENKDIIPVNHFKNIKMASIHIGVSEVSAFQNQISEYFPCQHFISDEVPDAEQLLKLKKETEEFNTIIVGVNGDWYDKDVNHSLYSFLHQVSEKANLILVHFGSGNKLAYLPDEHPFKAIVLSYASGKQAQEIAAQIIFGGVAAKGVLSKNINGRFTFGSGNFTNKTRIGYAPAFEKAYEDTLRLIDQLVYKAIRERAIPGCQVLVAQGGDVIYNKAFGYHTYSKKNHVEKSDMYDIASITKIMASVPMVMKMVDEGKMNLHDSLSHFLPRLENTNKSGMRIEDMLIHQAGLEAWIPFYMRTIDKEKLQGDIFSSRYSSQYNLKLDSRVYLNKSVRYRSDIFRHTQNEQFNVRVSDKLYMNKDFIDSMKLGIDTSDVAGHPSYKYSDLGYYYIKEIVEDTYKQPLDLLVENDFYKPLGAFKTLYKPLEVYNKKEIVPTENDRAWRKELLQGYVHDPGAAMLGGVGGHAGVFSNASDLVKILQMYLNKGIYGEERYIDSTTIKRFTSVVKEGNRRGIGFDKPVLDPELSGPTCHEASPSSFGHSGFTGTLVWVDPEYDLIYIFLSNRVHPNQSNKKLIINNVRTDIQSAIYRSLPVYWEKKSAKQEVAE